MHNLAKQIINEDQEKVSKEEQVWHFESELCGDACLLCTGEFTSSGAGRGTYEVRRIPRGGITCRLCLKIINNFKAIKL